MTAASSTRRIIILSALLTTCCLIGGFIVGGLIGNIVHGGLPGHMDEGAKIALAVVPALLGVIAGGALWGRALSGIAGTGQAKRMTWAGALGYGPTVILVGLALTVLENIIVEQGRGPALPIHVVFTLLFAPTALITAAVGGFALGVALRDASLAMHLALGSGLAAGLTFLAVNLMMDALGWRVGAPGAAERATMLTVMFTSNAAASLVGGAMIGWLLTRHSLTARMRVA